MARKKKREIWDLAEKKLGETVKDWSEFQEHPYVDLFVAILISSGRDRDINFIHSNSFDYSCDLLGLDRELTRKYILYTLEATLKQRKANFNIDDVVDDWE